MLYLQTTTAPRRIMFIFFVILVVLALGYVLLMEAYRRAWSALPEPILEASTPCTRFSVLVPARNEAANIVNLINDLCIQQYPKELFEILVIDDASEDETADLVREQIALRGAACKLRLLRLGTQEKGSKKRAIEAGLAACDGDFIVSIDADCRVPAADHLRRLDAFIRSCDLVFVAAPVVFAPARSPLERFQRLDFMGMMAITGAGIHRAWFYMCNGANMAYARQAFEQVRGFEGFKQYASGDDVFLLQKIAGAYPPERIGFLKSQAACVQTPPAAHWSSFVGQRLRWASKSKAYPDRTMQVMLLWVWLFHTGVLAGVCCLPWATGAVWALWGCAVLLKIFADYRLLSSACRFFGDASLPGKVFWYSLPLHTLYIAGIGLLANLPLRYVWKGRRTK